MKFNWLFCALITLALGIAVAASANAGIVGFLPDPEDSGGEVLGQNRFFIFNGWTKDNSLEAGDGNKFTGLKLDPDDPGYISGGNGAGPSWQVARTSYETVLGHPIGTGNVLRFSAWVATDADDPLMNEGTWTDTLKFEFNSAIGIEVFEREVGAGTNLFPSSCNLGTGVCGDPGTLGVNSAGWTLMSETYEIDAGDPLASVTIIEPVLFIGDYTGNETEQGTLYMDNLLVEVFEDLATANSTPLPNSYPGGHVPIPEPASLALSGMAVLGISLMRGRARALSHLP